MVARFSRWLSLKIVAFNYFQLKRYWQQTTKKLIAAGQANTTFHRQTNCHYRRRLHEVRLRFKEIRTEIRNDLGKRT